MTGSFWMSTEVRIYRSLSETPPDFGPCGLTVGNFDGVHAGHRELLSRVVHAAREHGWRAAAMTFHPHPAQVIAPGRAPLVMTTPEQRAELMAACGIEEVLVLPFTEETAFWSPEYFVRHVLVDKLQARTICVGEDFRFGHKHEGNTFLLQSLGAECGFTTEFIPPVRLRGGRVSSSRVRNLIQTGHVAAARRLLCAPFTLEGAVVPGHGIGKKETVPTLNLDPVFEVLPSHGVYVTRTTDIAGNQQWESVTNVGTRPTFSGDALTVETYVFGKLDSTPERIRVEFLARVRAERKFSSPEALKAQILHDVQSAQRYFRTLHSRVLPNSPRVII